MALTQSEYSAIRQIVREEIDPLKQDITSLKKGQKQLQAGQNIIIRLFDREYLALKRRVEVLERHSGIKQPKFEN